MAAQRPTSRLRNVRDLQSAQSLYKLLGEKLSLPAAGQVVQGIDRAWREEAKQVRRDLENRFGDIVRGTTATRVYPERGKPVPPQYTNRGFMTIEKPSRKRPAAGTVEVPRYLLAVEYDGQGEPIRVWDLGDPAQRRAFLSLFDGR